jgi:hypothetical protein
MLQWLSAIWLFLISLSVLTGRKVFKIYMISEIFAAIPSLFFFIVVALANLNPVHGFSVRELLFPALVMILFTIVPLLIAVRMWRKNVLEVSSISSREEHSPVSSLDS